MTYKDQPICLAYPVEKGFIKDQSQIATIVMSGNYGLVLDSLYIISANGKFNKELRSANEGMNKAVRVIDVMPGTYQLEVTFENTSYSMGQYRTTSTMKPLQEEVNLEAGEIYWLELRVFDTAAKLMTFKKVDLNSPETVVLKPLPEKYRVLIIESRNQLSF